MDAITLAQIPDECYHDYRHQVIFNAYKWDPQVEDHNTVAKHVAIIDAAVARKLEAWAQQLAFETMELENALMKRPDLAKKLGLSSAVRKAAKQLDGYAPGEHVRLMRFDFHPTATGWAISEVNSDVPGGLAEASVLPKIAQKYFPDCKPGADVAQHILHAFQKRIDPGARIALIHATSYSDDRQVMQFLGDYLEKNGYRALYAAPDHISWEQKQAVSIIRGEEGPVDALVRFFPLEWLANLPKRTGWRGYYDTKTLSCNHPVSIFAQSKRLPLVWDELGVDLTAWKQLLPETRAADAGKLEADWIYKPALGRVGEGISIKEAVTEKELAAIRKSVKRHPNDWIAQRRFESRPIAGADETDYHMCIGVFTVDAKAAGFYGRISRFPRIDARAKDIALLVRE